MFIYRQQTSTGDSYIANQPPQGVFIYLHPIGLEQYGLIADSDIFSKPIYLPIPIPIFFHQHTGHQYRYWYFHLGRYLADNCDFSRYFGWYPNTLANTNITDIQSSQYWYRYCYGQCRYPVCRYRYHLIYRLTDISSNPTTQPPQWMFIYHQPASTRCIHISLSDIHRGHSYITKQPRQGSLYIAN